MDEYSKLIYGLVGVGITSFVGYVLFKLSDYGTRIAVIESKEGSIKEMKDALGSLTKVVYEIAGKLGIAIRGD